MKALKLNKMISNLVILTTLLSSAAHAATELNTDQFYNEQNKLLEVASRDYVSYNSVERETTLEGVDSNSNLKCTYNAIFRANDSSIKISLMIADRSSNYNKSTTEYHILNNSYVNHIYYEEDNSTRKTTVTTIASASKNENSLILKQVQKGTQRWGLINKREYSFESKVIFHDNGHSISVQMFEAGRLEKECSFIKK